MRSTLKRSRLAFLPATALLFLAAPVQAAQGPNPFGALDSALMATEGVLGTLGAQTEDGKNVMFVWFENKAAALRWYYSPYHRAMQDQFFPNRPERVPLEHIPDGAGPILAVASVTFDPSQSPPFRQIAIELYQPLPGGLALGGTFAPERLVVPHMIRATDLVGRN